MGILIFFWLVRKHGNCIKIINDNTIIDYLFDANSIIYDSVYKLLKIYNVKSFGIDNFEMKLYDEIAEKINNYIVSLNPEKIFMHSTVTLRLQN